MIEVRIAVSKPFVYCRERALQIEAELQQVEQALAEVAVEEKTLAQEEEDCWKRYNALWLDLKVTQLHFL
jgi:hypothetical protein